MNERPTPVGDYFGLEKRDILGNLLNNPNFWEALSKANLWLNVNPDQQATIHSQESVGLLDPESEAFDILSLELGIDFANQPVNIIGHGYRKLDDQFKDKGLIAIKNGELGDFCSIPSNEPIYVESEDGSYIYRHKHRVAGIEIHQDDQVYAFPFSKKSLAAFELWDLPESDLPDYIVDLQRQANVVRAELNSSEFYDLDSAEQADLLDEQLDHMDETLQLYDSEESYYNVTAKHYYNLRFNDQAAPEISEQSSEREILLNYRKCRVVIPELLEKSSFSGPSDFPISHGEPMLLLSSPESSRAALVSLSDILMYELVERYQPSSRNLLALLTDPKINSVLQLHASEAEFSNSFEEFEEVKASLNANLENLLGIDIEGRDLVFDGILHTPNGRAGYSMRYVQGKNVNSLGYDVRYIGDEWQVVLVVKHQEVKSYIIPRPPHSLGLEVLEESRFDNPDD